MIRLRLTRIRIFKKMSSLSSVSETNSKCNSLSQSSITTEAPTLANPGIETDSTVTDSLVTNLRRDGTILDWDQFLRVFQNLKYVPPVNYFKHAPLADIWEQVASVSQRIEVPNVYVPLCKAGMIYWIATVNCHKGYKACIEYERFGMKRRYLTWISYCTSVPKPIGWCFFDKKTLLFPDAEVRKEYPNFLEEMYSLFEENGGFQTIPFEHARFCHEKIMSTRRLLLPNGESKMIQIGSILEVIDRKNLGLIRLAKVQAIVGDRFHAEYTGDKEDILGFWFSINSDAVHLPGWAQMVRHPIKDVNFKSPKLGELRDEHFPSFPSNVIIEKGMWLEVRHPVHLFSFNAAKIDKVLRFGYIMLKIEREAEADIKICYHITSPLIFPIGFAQSNQLIFDPPYEANVSSSEFSWTKFLETRNQKSLIFGNIPPQPRHEFNVGHKLEAIDLNQPTFLGPATIIKIVEHMLLIHFDSWAMNKVNCQWVEANSPHIYPIGWAELVSHKFEGTPAWPVENILKEASEKNLI